MTANAMLLLAFLTLPFFYAMYAVILSTALARHKFLPEWLSSWLLTSDFDKAVLAAWFSLQIIGLVLCADRVARFNMIGMGATFLALIVLTMIGRLPE